MKTLPLAAAVGVGLLLAFPACYRAPDRTGTLHLPEARDKAELLMLAEFLVADNRHMEEDGDMILEVVPLPDLPGLRVRYDPLKTALKNLEHRVAAAGFTANETPGNPESRALFRAGNLQPR